MAVLFPPALTMASFWKRLRRRARAPRGLAFTRAGRYFVLLTLGVGFGAINTGNNLLFLLLGMMLSLIIASGLLSEAVIRRISAERLLPDRCFAERAAAGEFEVDNEGWYPSLSVHVVEGPADCEVGPRRGDMVGPERGRWWAFWESADTLAASVASGYSVRVDAGESKTIGTRYRFPARGIYQLRELRLLTRFPFSFFEKTRELDRPASVTVYPTPREADDWGMRARAAVGTVPAGESGRGDEYFGLREYQPDEDKRLIHWKRSAARGELVIREHEERTNRSAMVHLLNATGRPASERDRAAPEFERLVEKVAGLILELDAKGWQIGLATLDDRLGVAPVNDVDNMLRCLAEVDLHDELSEESLEPAGPETADLLVGLPKAIDRCPGSWDAIFRGVDDEGLEPLDSMPEAA